MKTEKHEFRTIWYLSVGAQTGNDSKVAIVAHNNIFFNYSPLHPFVRTAEHEILKIE